MALESSSATSAIVTKFAQQQVTVSTLTRFKVRDAAIIADFGWKAEQIGRPFDRDWCLMAAELAHFIPPFAVHHPAAAVPLARVCVVKLFQQVDVQFLLQFNASWPANGPLLNHGVILPS